MDVQVLKIEDPDISVSELIDKLTQVIAVTPADVRATLTVSCESEYDNSYGDLIVSRKETDEERATREQDWANRDAQREANKIAVDRAEYARLKAKFGDA